VAKDRALEIQAQGFKNKYLAPATDRNQTPPAKTPKK